MVATDKREFPQDRLANLDKALRRGKKLERTLLKIIAQSEPVSDLESLLKSVQQGLKTLKAEIKKAERSASSDTKKKPARRKTAPKAITLPETSSKPAGRSRKKEPAPAQSASGENQAAPQASK